MFLVNSKLFLRKCGQLDKSMDNFVYTFYQIRKQCFMWIVNSSPESVDNLNKVWTKLSTLEKQWWTVYVNSIHIGLKVWTIFLKCGQHCPHLLQTWCTVPYYRETCLYPETCFNLANFCKLGSQYTSNITFIKLLHSWNSPWFEYIKNLEQPTSNNSNTYALLLSLHWDHKIH